MNQIKTFLLYLACCSSILLLLYGCSSITDDGNSYYRQGNYKEAEKKYTQATQIDPTSVLNWDKLGWTQFQQKKYVEAEKSFNKALELNPNYSTSVKGIGQSLYRQNKNKEALPHLEKTIRLLPHDSWNYNWLAHCYYNLGQFAPAVTHFETAIKKNPKFWGNHYYQGWSYFNQKEFSSALLKFRKTEAMFKSLKKSNAKFYNENNSYLQVALGRTLYSLMLYQKAAPYLKEAYNLGKKDWLNHNWLAWNHFQMGKYDESITLFNSAQNIKKNDSNEYGLGNCYVAKGDYGTAHTHLKERSYFLLRNTKKDNQISITGLTPLGPGDLGGLKVGDIFKMIGETEINSATTVEETSKTINALEYGKFHKVVIERNGETLEKEIFGGITPDFKDQIAGYFERNYKMAQKQKSILAMENYLKNFEKTPYREKAFLELNKLILKKKKSKREGLFFETYSRIPEYYNFMPKSYQLNMLLLLMGPKELTIGQIKKMIQQRVMEPVIISKISLTDAPYKNFTVDEIKKLKSWKFKDSLISAMMNHTLKINNKREEERKKQELMAQEKRIQEEREKLKKEREELARERKNLAEQQKKNQRSSPRTPINKVNPVNSLGNKIMNCTQRNLALRACKNLGWPASTLCEVTARATYPCR